jgi:hypothetical protein
MTLETDVATLITATNTLTQTVTGKVAEIDAAVVDMKNQVDGAYKNTFTDIITIVDAVSGNDAAADENNATVQTIAEAFRRLKPFKNNRILLRANQTHVFDQTVIVGGDMHHRGLEYGTVHIYDHDQSASGAPSASSPVLAWNATLVCSMNIIFGGSDAPITILHNSGLLTSQNPMASWGTGQPTHADTVISYSQIYLNSADQGFIGRPGSIYLRGTAVYQEAANALLAKASGATKSFIQEGCTLLGTQEPRQWSQLLDDMAPISQKALDARFASVRRMDVYVNTDTGHDKNDGLTAETAVRTATRAAQVLKNNTAIDQYLFITGTADFIVDADITMYGARNSLGLNQLTGQVVFPATAIVASGVTVGEGINHFLFSGTTNTISLSNGPGATRKAFSLPTKMGYTGNGSENVYQKGQGAFRFGEPYSIAASHLTIIGGDLTIGDNQTLTARYFGHINTGEITKKLVVGFSDCVFTMGTTESYKVYGVSEATGTITDNYT